MKLHLHDFRPASALFTTEIEKKKTNASFSLSFFAVPKLRWIAKRKTFPSQDPGRVFVDETVRNEYPLAFFLPWQNLSCVFRGSLAAFIVLAARNLHYFEGLNAPSWRLFEFHLERQKCPHEGAHKSDMKLRSYLFRPYKG